MDSHLGQWVLVITISFEPGLTKEPSYDQGLLKLIKKQSAKKCFISEILLLCILAYCRC